MGEQLLREPELKTFENDTKAVAREQLGKITVLEALSEESIAISINASHRSTQMGNGVDAEDD